MGQHHGRVALEISYPNWNAGLPADGEASAGREVNNSAERLLLSAAVRGSVIVQTDDDTVWMLKAGGDPAASGDWVLIGRRGPKYLGVVANEAGMVAKVAAKRGDWVVRADLEQRAEFTGTNPATAGHWTVEPSGASGVDEAALALKADKSAVLLYDSPITGLTGGVGKLDGIATVALAAGTKVGFILSDDFGITAYSYELVLDPFGLFGGFPELVDPLDFHFSENPKRWRLRASGTKSKSILDATAVGRAVLTATDADAARDVLDVRKQNSVVAVRSNVLAIPDGPDVPHAGTGMSGFPQDVVLLSHLVDARGEFIALKLKYATEIEVGDPPAVAIYNQGARTATVRVRPESFATIGLMVAAINTQLLPLQGDNIYLRLEVGESAGEEIPEFWVPPAPYGNVWDAYLGGSFGGFPEDVVLTSGDPALSVKLVYASSIPIGQPPDAATYDSVTRVVSVRIRPQTYATIGAMFEAVNVSLEAVQVHGINVSVYVDVSWGAAIPAFGVSHSAYIDGPFAGFPEDVVLTSQDPAFVLKLVYDESIALGQPVADATYDDETRVASVKVRPEDYADIGEMVAAINPALAALAADDIHVSIDVGESGDAPIPMFVDSEDLAKGGFAGKDGDKIIVRGPDYATEFYLFNGFWYPAAIGGAAPGESQDYPGSLLGANQSAEEETAYLTRLLMVQEAMLSIGGVRDLFPGLSGLANNSGTGAASAVAKGAGFELNGGNAAAGWSRHGITRDLMAVSLLSGSNANCGTDFALAIHGAMGFGVAESEAGRAAVRFVVGDSGAGAVPAPGVPAITGKGFGVEFSYDGAGSVDVRLFAHDGANYASALVGTFVTSKSGTFQLLLIKEGVKARVRVAGSAFAGNIARLTAATELASLTGVPTTGTYAQPWVSALTVNHAADAPVVPAVLHVLHARVLIRDGNRWI